MSDTDIAYLETFGCHLETEDEHDHEGDCEWGYACGTCGRSVDLEPCPEHAPREVPGLMLMDCQATPRHHVWVLAHDSYDAPCLSCQLSAQIEAHRGDEHAHHKPWRRWKLAHKLAGYAYSLGVVRGHGSVYGGGCKGCMTGFRWGRSSYLLGWDNWKWKALPHCLRRGHWPAEHDACTIGGRGMDFCVKCAPCPGCETCKPGSEELAAA